MYYAAIAIVVLLVFIFRSKSKSQSAPAEFHGFYIDENPSGMRGLPVAASTLALLNRTDALKFTLLDKEKYWLGYGRFMITHAPQAYVAWHGNTYWCVELPYVDEQNKYVDSKTGVHLFRFNKIGELGYVWLDTNSGFSSDELDTLVQDAWMWKLEGQGKEKSFKLNSELASIAKQNVAWTETWHRELKVKYPPEDYWN